MREGTIVFFHESGCVVLVDRGEGGCGGSKWIVDTKMKRAVFKGNGEK